MLLFAGCAESEDLDLLMAPQRPGAGGLSGASGAGGEGSGGAGSGGQAGTVGSAGSLGTGGASGSGGSAVRDAGGTANDSGNAGIFFDDFETGNAANWQSTVPADWSVVTDGSTRAYEQRTVTNSLHVATAGSTLWSDQAVEARVKVLSFGGASTSYLTAVYARFRDLDNYYSLAVDSSTKLTIRANANGSKKTLTPAVTSGMTTNAWYTVKLQVKGSNLTAYVDGVEKASTTDSSIATGGIGLGCVNSSARFDDVKVTVP